VDVAKKLGSRKELAGAYASLAARDPSDHAAQEFLAAWHLDERNYLDAAHHYRQLARARPGDAKAWEDLGNCLAMIPDLEAAGEALQVALDLGAVSEETYVNRARAYRQEGSRDMAASILDFLLSRNPRSYLALAWSARFAAEDGQSELAAELLERASREAPPGLERAGL
jgi:Flp pilus assembly protein TadD